MDLRNHSGNDLSRMNVPAYGQNIFIPTSDFTRERQEQIINNHFNGNGSLYADVYNQRTSASNEQAPAPVAPQQPAQPQVDVEDYQRLKRMEEQILQGRYQAPSRPNEPQQLPTQNEQQAQSESEDPIDKILRDIYGTGSNETQAPQQPQQQTNESNDNWIVNEISQIAVTQGHNPKDVISFIEKLKPSDFVMLYDAYTKSNQQQAPRQEPQQPQRRVQQPVNLSEAPAPSVVRTQYMPNNAPRNPFFS